jgi:hypothetical protein
MSNIKYTTYTVVIIATVVVATLSYFVSTLPLPQALTANASAAYSITNYSSTKMLAQVEVSNDSIINDNTSFSNLMDDQISTQLSLNEKK